MIQNINAQLIIGYLFCLKDYIEVSPDFKLEIPENFTLIGVDRYPSLFIQAILCTDDPLLIPKVKDIDFTRIEYDLYEQSNNYYGLGDKKLFLLGFINYWNETNVVMNCKAILF
jgi:hypothetical protein